MESPVSMRRPCFVEDDGLASVAEMEAGFSGNNNNNYYYVQNTHQNQHPFSGNLAPIMMRRRNSLRNLSSLSSPVSVSSASVASPRSGRFFDARFEEPPHFLEACFLCKKPLGGNRDIFMYRGDTPFCSEECREDQIEIDEAKEKSRKMKVLRSKKEKTKSAANSSSSSSSTARKSQNYPFRTGTVAAA